ncbi:MAG: hypothetical protein KBA26_12820 [Candidatus Delongbacteria bacterium]|nr:hypothetical protein [Candidatus Delongbacteria bacterium]
MKRLGLLILLLLIAYFTWEKCLGWYIHRFNSHLPQIGGFWSDYKKYTDADSSKQDWFKVEELRSIATEEGIAYLKDLNGILQKSGQLVISMDHFAQFYHILPESFKQDHFPPYRYIGISLNPECRHAVFNYRDGQTLLYFTNPQDQALPGEVLFPGLFPEDSSLFAFDAKPELQDWIMVDTTDLTIQYRSFPFRTFFNWVDTYYSSHRQKIIRDEFLIVDWIDHIDSVYILAPDSTGSFIIKVRTYQDSTLWRQDFLPDHLPYIRECIQSEEYSF